MQVDYYIVSINNGEEELNFTFESDARKLYNDLIEDPAEHYHKIELLYYNYVLKKETLVDSYIFPDELTENIEYTDDNRDFVPTMVSTPDIEDINSILTKLVYNTACAINDLRYIHWFCAGPQFDCIHNLTDAYINKLNEDLDILAELALELPGVRLANLSGCSEKIDYTPISSELELDYNKSITEITNILTIYLDNLNKINNCSECTGHIQSVVDDIYAFWSKELNFKLIRMGG